MKNILIFTLTLVSVLLTSCGENIPYEEKVVENLRQQMKNPDSFRLDSILYTPKFLSDGLEGEIKFDSIMIDLKLESRDSYQESVNRNEGLSYMADLVKMYKQTVEEYQNEIDSLKNHMVNTQVLLSEVKGTDKDTLVLHTYKAFYMAQNSFGAMIKGTAYIETFNGSNINVKTEK